jgi:hypothetical protein
MLPPMPAFAALLALLAALGGGANEPSDFVAEERDEQLAFSYSWPAAVEVEPVLRARLAREMAAERVEARRTAKEDRVARGGDFPFNPHDFEKTWRIAGGTERLLSLAASMHSYTGGAHGNLAFDALLWDRNADRPVEPAALLGAEAIAALTPRYCAALDAEREERRGEPVQRDSDDSFSACPPLAEQVLAFRDSDGNGRFDMLEALIPPYVAGPWVEGPYPLEVPFAAADLGGIPAEYRMSFESGR